jgi:signal transduction histidine kinase
MTPGKSMARRHTCITAGVTTATTTLFYLTLTLAPPLTPFGRIALPAAFLLITTLSVYLVARRHAGKMTAWIENTCQSEKSFISNASHELNNPLTAIQGECEISLMKERTPAEYQASLRRIASETRRIIQLMKHLMFLSKGEEEILKSPSETVSLAEFLMQFMEKRIRFAPDNYAFMISVNPHLLKIALSNIIGNALKYSGDRTVDIRLRGSVLEISDRGIGIPPEELPGIFQPFYRAANTRGYAGNGIGLSLAIRILHVYGAEVTVASGPGEGTKVKIDFRHAR